MIQLRDYQINSIKALRENGTRRAVLVIPTGGGKTTIAAEIIRRINSKNLPVLFIAHRQELIYQCHDRLKLFGIESGIIMAGVPENRKQLTQVASIQTLNRRSFPNAEFIFFDEAHHVAANSFKKIQEHYNDKFFIGLTATPYRLDGKPLGKHFDKIVAPISVAQLTAEGHLCPVRYFAPKSNILDLDSIKTKMGDFDNNQMFKAFDKPKLYEGVVNNYLKFGMDKKAIVFNVNIEHSKNMASEFAGNGFMVEHLDGGTNNTERKEILNRFKTGETKILCNVGILTEGYDLPDIEVVIINRATQSKSLYFQMVGRGLRPAQNKDELIVIDHGENIKRHGFIDEDQQYSLKTKEKKPGVAPVKECKDCKSLIHASLMECPYCGYIFISFKKEKLNIIEEFQEIKKVKLPFNLRKPWSKCSESELKEIAAIKGYKKGWVYHQLKLQNKI